MQSHVQQGEASARQSNTSYSAPERAAGKVSSQWVTVQHVLSFYEKAVSISF